MAKGDLPPEGPQEQEWEVLLLDSELTLGLSLGLGVTVPGVAGCLCCFFRLELT